MENPWVAKQLLLITKVRREESHPERANNLSRRKSWGSSGTSPLSVPHLLPCATQHLVYHLKEAVRAHLPALSTPRSVPSSSHCPESPTLPLFPHSSLSALPAVSISAPEYVSTTAFHLVIMIGFTPILHLKLMKAQIYLELKTKSILTLTWLRNLETCNYLMHI